jgi:cinnamyl-alcohol dehydrogenase
MLPWEAGRSLGVVGLGGLGHVAVKFGKAFGLRVTVIRTSPGKEREARESLKTDDFVLSTDHKQMQVWKYIHVQYKSMESAQTELIYSC